MRTRVGERGYVIQVRKPNDAWSKVGQERVVEQARQGYGAQGAN